MSGPGKSSACAGVRCPTAPLAPTEPAPNLLTLTALCYMYEPSRDSCRQRCAAGCCLLTIPCMAVVLRCRIPETLALVWCDHTSTKYGGIPFASQVFRGICGIDPAQVRGFPQLRVQAHQTLGRRRQKRVINAVVFRLVPFAGGPVPAQTVQNAVVGVHLPELTVLHQLHLRQYPEDEDRLRKSLRKSSSGRRSNRSGTSTGRRQGRGGITINGGGGANSGDWRRNSNPRPQQSQQHDSGASSSTDVHSSGGLTRFPVRTHGSNSYQPPSFRTNFERDSNRRQETQQRAIPRGKLPNRHGNVISVDLNSLRLRPQARAFHQSSPTRALTPCDAASGNSEEHTLSTDAAFATTTTRTLGPRVPSVANVSTPAAVPNILVAAALTTAIIGATISPASINPAGRPCCTDTPTGLEPAAA